MKFAPLLLVICWLGQLRAEITLQIRVGDATPLHAKAAHWKSSAPEVAQVYQNGFVVGLRPGQARILGNGSVASVVSVSSSRESLVNPATLKQFPDNRPFTVAGRKCYGSELNGQRAVDPAERGFIHDNRVINPAPLRADKPLDWELQPNTEVRDGAGVLMGTVPPSLEVAGRRVPVSMFNFGASKVMGGRIYVYAFSVSINSSAAGRVSTSAWLPLDNVVNKEALLERAGLGKTRLPVLPLEATGYRITGGNPKQYLTPYGELSIVRQLSIGAVPSHYLRRPSGTINLVYSVPGFGLGGEGTDSFLVSDGLEFYPAIGAKIFKQPTYYPSKHPQAGKISPETMTFLYGAIKTEGSDPIYGWIAKEAVAPR